MGKVHLITAIYLFGSCVLCNSQVHLDNERIDTVAKTSYISIGAGYMKGEFEYFHKNHDSQYYDNYIANPEHVNAGMVVSFTQKSGKFRKRTFGIRICGGSISESRRSSYTGGYTMPGNATNQYGCNPFYSTHWRNFGIKAGFQIGNFYSQEKILHFLPQFSMRAGPCDIFYLEWMIADHSPCCFPAPIFKMGIGTGFGQSNGTGLSIGIASHAGFYFSGRAVLFKRIVIEAFAGYRQRNRPLIGYFDFNLISGNLVSINLEYRFTHLK